jgi:hypothetical protein
MATDYTALSLADVRAELHAIASDVQSVFGRLDEAQLNWRPDAARWSVAQCFDHLLTANREMLLAAGAATDGTSSQTVWQRLPILPGLFGRMLIKSQTPDSKRKFTAPRRATPAASGIDAQVIDRFLAHQREAVARVQALDGRDAGRIIMVSPFVSFITYSVLDGCRLIVAHERRHFEQARRVTREPEFPPPDPERRRTSGSGC